jgi:pectin methylesterase-like acyl-CoA thioesterase
MPLPSPWPSRTTAAGAAVDNTRSVVHAPDGTLVVEAGFSIQAAVDACRPTDDTITVGTGTYTEQVVIDGKDGLTLQEDTGADVTIAAPTTLVSTGNSPTGSRARRSTASSRSRMRIGCHHPGRHRGRPALGWVT